MTEHLLVLAHRIPYPPNKGDKIRAWNILNHLAARYQVHLGCFVDDPRDAPHAEALRRICASVHCQALNPALARLRSLAALSRGEAMTIRYYSSPAMRSWIEATLRQYPIRRAFVYCSAMAPYVMSLRGATRVLDMVDVDSRKWAQYAAVAPLPFRRLYAREGRMLLRFERDAAAAVDATLLASPAEAALFRSLAPGPAAPIHAMSNGVDLDYFSPDRAYPCPFPAASRPIVFTGAMDYRPNIDAAAWFVEQVMPLLASQDPSPEFWIVGSDPARQVRRLAQRDGIHVTGRVDDVRPFLAHAAAVVAPLRIARGIQNKILEAMAMAKPVVATAPAKEGIDAADGEELLIAETAHDHVARLRIAFSERGIAIGRRARCRMEAGYRWSDHLQVLDALLEGRSPGSAPTPAAPAGTTRRRLP